MQFPNHRLNTSNTNIPKITSHNATPLSATLIPLGQYQLIQRVQQIQQIQQLRAIPTHQPPLNNNNNNNNQQPTTHPIMTHPFQNVPSHRTHITTQSIVNQPFILSQSNGTNCSQRQLVSVLPLNIHRTSSSLAHGNPFSNTQHNNAANNHTNNNNNIHVNRTHNRLMLKKGFLTLRNSNSVSEFLKTHKKASSSTMKSLDGNTQNLKKSPHDRECDDAKMDNNNNINNDYPKIVPINANNPFWMVLKDLRRHNNSNNNNNNNKSNCNGSDERTHSHTSSHSSHSSHSSNVPSQTEAHITEAAATVTDLSILLNLFNPSGNSAGAMDNDRQIRLLNELVANDANGELSIMFLRALLQSLSSSTKNNNTNNNKHTNINNGNSVCSSSTNQSDNTGNDDHSAVVHKCGRKTSDKLLSMIKCEQNNINNNNGNHNNHGHDDIKGTYVCNYCLSQFRFKKDLHKHELQHNRERPYNCRDCLKQFASQIALANHRKSKHQ